MAVRFAVAQALDDLDAGSSTNRSIWSDAEWISYFVSPSSAVGDSELLGVSYMTGYLRDPDVVAIMGFQATCQVEARLASIFDKLLISPACPDSRPFESPADFPTLVVLNPTAADYGPGIAAIIRALGIETVTILYYQPPSGHALTAIKLQSTREALRKAFVKVTAVPYKSKWFQRTANYLMGGVWNNTFLTALTGTYLNTRVYIIINAGSEDDVQYFLQLADRMGVLQSGEYLFLFESIDGMSAASEAVEDYSYFVTILAGTYYSSVLYSRSLEESLQWNRALITVGREFAEGATATMQKRINSQVLKMQALTGPLGTSSQRVDVPAAWRCPPLCIEGGKVAPRSVNQTSLDVRQLAYHDATMILAAVFAELNMTDTTAYSGRLLASAIRNRTYNGGVLGRYFLNENGTSQAAVVFYHKKALADIKAGEPPVAPIAKFEDGALTGELNLNWILGKPVRDAPSCGFDGNRCPPFVRDVTWQWITAGVVAVVAVLGWISLLLYRQVLYEKQIESQMWKIQLSDITALNKDGTGEDSNRNVILDERIVFAAAYKSQTVAIKRIQKATVELSADVRMELRRMLDVHHENLCSFLGAIYEQSRVFVVLEYCQRNALEDVSIRLDMMFLSSMVFDIIAGMKFIHSGAVGAHGRLKSTNTLLTARWVVKLSGFGLNNFRSGETSPKSDTDRSEALLWTAPELLRDLEILKKPLKFTKSVIQKADSYSFGILLHEMFCRSGVFGGDIADPMEAIKRLMEPPAAHGALRPNLELVEHAPACVQELLAHCWDEDPASRPTFAYIARSLRPLRKGQRANIFDSLVALMEKHANNLEDLVKQRSMLLDEERRKSEKILLMLIPKQVAEQLKAGKQVEAEQYDCASYFFSDIVHFTTLCSQSTPLQVVALLNDLYTMFDAIIRPYDVYKVATIGDAYFVVSGLPTRNGNLHAGEIASMSLNLLDSIKNFKIRHRPNEQLKLRAGIHTGPCVAGVVGNVMPRYLLFGDSVNMAMLMESSGEAQRVHCSLECKRLLDALGGYSVTERGMTCVKGRDDQQTFWLVSEDKSARLLRCGGPANHG